MREVTNRNQKGNMRILRQFTIQQPTTNFDHTVETKLDYSVKGLRYWKLAFVNFEITMTQNNSVLDFWFAISVVNNSSTPMSAVRSNRISYEFDGTYQISAGINLPSVQEFYQNSLLGRKAIAGTTDEALQSSGLFLDDGHHNIIQFPLPEIIYETDAIISIIQCNQINGSTYDTSIANARLTIQELAL